MPLSAVSCRAILPAPARSEETRMDAVATAAVHAELAGRRSQLEAALASMGRPPALVQLLEDVDSALQRIDHGTYGLCETCHDPIEADRLAADPLTRFCIDHLDREQRAALEADLALASRIQQGLLPPNDLVRCGWEVSHHYQPAGPVGGDYCDLLTQDDSFVFLLGDVSGKGVASSLLASHLHAVFRGLCAGPMPVSQIMARANRLFCESTLTSHYATLVCGRAQPGGDVEVASAGHCPPLRIRGAETLSLEATGLPLGLFCSSEFTTHRLHLEPGDCLLLYSDGLVEARNLDGSEYGGERLQEAAVSAARHVGSRLVAAEILALPAEGPLVDFAVVQTRERHAGVFQFHDQARRRPAHIFDGVLIAEIVAALDGVVHVPVPVVGQYIGERGVHAALGGDGV